MFKYLSVIAAAMVFAAFAGSSSAVTPPKYLEIKDFKLCLAIQKFDTWEGWCMPAQKPGTCPAESWQQLNALEGEDKLSPCPTMEN